MPCILKIRVIAAVDLPVMDKATELADAYVEVRFADYETQRTAIVRRSLNPVWNEDFRFEVSNDADLQNEPLELRVLDYDTLSANDAIGSVYIDLNPLLTFEAGEDTGLPVTAAAAALPNQPPLDSQTVNEGNPAAAHAQTNSIETMQSTIGDLGDAMLVPNSSFVAGDALDASTNLQTVSGIQLKAAATATAAAVMPPPPSNDDTMQISGWFPIYDTIRGIRGSICAQIKLQFFGDVNPFKDSSAGVLLFGSPSVPCGYQIDEFMGFVEVLLNEDDPEYHWVDSFRASRVSNETRQRLLYRLSGNLRRLMGREVLEMGGNAVIGFKQYLDMENEECVITARAIGTCVKISLPVAAYGSGGNAGQTASTSQTRLGMRGSQRRLSVPESSGGGSGSREDLLSIGGGGSIGELVGGSIGELVGGSGTLVGDPAALLPSTLQGSSDGTSNSSRVGMQAASPNASIGGSGSSEPISIPGSSKAVRRRKTVATARTPLSNSILPPPTPLAPPAPLSSSLPSAPSTTVVADHLATDLEFCESSGQSPSFHTIIAHQSPHLQHHQQQQAQHHQQQQQQYHYQPQPPFSTGPRSPVEMMTESQQPSTARFSNLPLTRNNSTFQHSENYRNSSEPQLITLNNFPAGSIAGLGGLICARSVKLLQSDDIETRRAWWEELRDEIRSHAKALGCRFVIGYTETTTINDELCVLSAIGTAANIDLRLLGAGSGGGFTLPNFHSRGGEDNSSPAAVGDDAATNTSYFINPRLPADAVSYYDSSSVCQSSGGAAAVQLAVAGSGTSTTKTRGASHRWSLSNAAINGPAKDHQYLSLINSSSCQCIHIPYHRRSSPFTMVFVKCAVCKRRYVPELLFASIEMPEELETLGESYFVQAHVCRVKKRKSESNAAVISDSLPFIEYDIHRQLMYKLRIQGLNAIFGLRIHLAISDHLIIAVAAGTAVFLTALPAPPPLRISRNLDVVDAEDHRFLAIQKQIIELSEGNRKRIERERLKYQLASANAGGDDGVVPAGGPLIETIVEEELGAAFSNGADTVQDPNSLAAAAAAAKNGSFAGGSNHRNNTGKSETTGVTNAATTFAAAPSSRIGSSNSLLAERHPNSSAQSLIKQQQQQYLLNSQARFVPQATDPSNAADNDSLVSSDDEDNSLDFLAGGAQQQQQQQQSTNIVVHIDDDTDEDLIAVLLDPPPLSNFLICTTEMAPVYPMDTFLPSSSTSTTTLSTTSMAEFNAYPGRKNEEDSNTPLTQPQHFSTQIICLVKEHTINNTATHLNRQLAAVFHELIYDIRAALWFFNSCALTGLRYHIEFAADLQLQIRVTALAIGSLAIPPTISVSPPSAVADTQHSHQHQHQQQQQQQQHSQQGKHDALNPLFGVLLEQKAVVAVTADQSQTIPLSVYPQTMNCSGAGFNQQQQQQQHSVVENESAQRLIATAASPAIDQQSAPPFIDITPLAEIPGYRISKFIGRLSLHFVKEDWNLHHLHGHHYSENQNTQSSDFTGEQEEIGRFVHRFMIEVQAIARAHTCSMGGNALIAFRIEHGAFRETLKNQAYGMVSVSGDVVFVDRTSALINDDTLAVESPTGSSCYSSSGVLCEPGQTMRALRSGRWLNSGEMLEMLWGKY